jgi:predicted metal-binding membrane protein
MWLSKQISYAILFGIIGISMLVWVLLLINPGNIMTIEHCKAPTLVLCSGSTTTGTAANSLQMLLDLNPFSSQLMGWGGMIVAMMLPKLIIPIEYIYIRSLKRYRFIFSVLFVLGYLSTWMFAGIFMTAIIMGFHLWLPFSNLPAIGVGLVAAIWQCSPIKQRFLNLGHDHWNLPAFGFPAFCAVSHFGIMHGVWCVGAGWALMLLPMLLQEGHNLAMLIVTFMMISEHLEHPRPLRWSFKPRLKLLKIIIAQAKIKVKYS